MSYLASPTNKEEDSINTSAADQLAERCALHLYEKDNACYGLGIELVQMKCGSTVVAMTVTDAMLNGHLNCHGGMIFTLADTAFGYAANSQNQAAVGSSCTIDYILPAFKGDILTASAEQQHQGGRSGIYQIKVTNQNQQLIAILKGNSARLKRKLLPD